MKPPPFPPNRDRFQPKTPPKGVAAQLAVPESVEEDVTGRYEGDALRAARERRPTPQRLARLEASRDELTAVVTEIRVDVAEMKGELKLLPDLVRSVKDSADRLAAREHVAFAADAQVQAARAATEVGEQANKRNARRQFVMWLLTSATTGAVLMKILHHFGVL